MTKPQDLFTPTASFAVTGSAPDPALSAWSRLLSRDGAVVLWATDDALRVVAMHGPQPTRDAVIGALRLGSWDADDGRAAREAHLRALSGGPVSFALSRDGAVYEIQLEALVGSDGAPTGVAGVARDVTRRDDLRAQLRQRERELAAFSRFSPDTITRYDRDHRVLFMSDAVERETGVPGTAYVGRTMREMNLPAELVERWESTNDRVFATGTPEEAEFSFVGPDGVERYYLTHVVPERDDAGRITHVLTITRDITARVLAERAARAADLTLRSLFAQSLTGIYVIQDGVFVYANPRFAEQFGYRGAEEIVGRPVSDLVDPEDRLRVSENLRRRLTGEESAVHYSFRGCRADGSLIHVEVFGSRAEHAGRPAVVGTLLDVTERVHARRALEESEERFRALVERSSDLIAILEPDGCFRYASPSHEHVLGLPPAQLQGQHIEGETLQSYLHADDVEVGRAALTVALRDGTARTARPVRFRHRDGSWRALSVVFTDLRESPAVRGVVANARDVTEQYALETQLREVQKLEAIGRLAGGVAHDFNNILAAISGYAQLLRESLASSDPRRADVDEIIAASNRGAGVTRQLLAFSRRQALETEVLDFALVVRELGRMLRSLLPASISLDLPSPRAEVHVRAVRAQLEQIVMNLAVNARDAMPQGGRLSLDVTTRSIGGVPRAVLVVADTGCGMSPEVRARIFEPFFTTKAQGQGTGLGLATVFGLVRQFGGAIDVSSEEGAGSSFEVTFPLAEAPAPAVTAPAAEAAHTTADRARRVLVVEDEPQVRDIARRILQRAGYAVVEAANGVEALARLAAGESVDLVLTDAAMPGLSGWELAARVETLYPSTPVVLMSGYAELSGGAEQSTATIRAFLEKPFSGPRLLEAVSEALVR